MSGPPELFDRRAVRAHRDRAVPALPRVMPLLAEVAARLVERLDDVKRRFSLALDLGGRGAVAGLMAARGIAVVSADPSALMAARSGGLAVAADPEFLPFRSASFDLVLATLALHWSNDLPGALIQLRDSLVPGGLFLASLPILGTLGELRAALAEAETELAGGAAPRVSPLPDLRDCAALMQRAGFELPVADAEEIVLRYPEPKGLIADLRAAGETNALKARSRRPPPRMLFPAALARLAGRGGEVAVTLRLAYLTGWAPARLPRRGQ